MGYYVWNELYRTELYNIIFNTVSRWSIYLINRKSTGIWIRNYDRDWSRDFNRAIWN